MRWTMTGVVTMIDEAHRNLVTGGTFMISSMNDMIAFVKRKRFVRRAGWWRLWWTMTRWEESCADTYNRALQHLVSG